MDETTLKKLQFIKAENKLILNAPEQLLDEMEADTFNVKPIEEKKGVYDFVLIFGEDKAKLTEVASRNIEFAKYDGYFWLAYPKGTGKIKSDLKREVVWQILQDIGLKAVTQVSIDETWSALRGRPKALYG